MDKLLTTFIASFAIGWVISWVYNSLTDWLNSRPRKGVTLIPDGKGGYHELPPGIEYRQINQRTTND